MNAKRRTSVEALARETRDRLGQPPSHASWPAVSIVAVNRDGVEHLRRLVAGLAGRTDYPELDLIVVDNGSGDDSVEFLRRVEAPFPISILANPHNESFSDACNQGAELAGGELLLFLNNDIEPFEPGWLRELVACLRRRSAGIAGSTLLRPAPGSTWGYVAQHRAILIADDDGMLDPDRGSFGADPFGEGLGEDARTPAPAGACVLIDRQLFDGVSGFSGGFHYGGEDIDLGLKVLAEGRSVVCSGRSLLIHRLGSTRRETTDAERQLEIGLRNRRLLWERWGPRVRREYELDRIAGGGIWASPAGRSPEESPSREEALALGFCLKASEPALPPPVEKARGGLCAALSRRGHLSTLLRGEEGGDLVGLNHDVAVHLRGPARYLPKPAQLNVLWAVSHLDALSPVECDGYHLVVAPDTAAADRLSETSGRAAIVVVALDDPDGLIDAVLARAEEIGYPSRLAGGRRWAYGKVGA